MHKLEGTRDAPEHPGFSDASSTPSSCAGSMRAADRLTNCQSCHSHHLRNTHSPRLKQSIKTCCLGEALYPTLADPLVRGCFQALAISEKRVATFGGPFFILVTDPREERGSCRVWEQGQERGWCGQLDPLPSGSAISGTHILHPSVP